MLLADVLPKEVSIWVFPIAWGFAFWGIWLYWWTGFVYLRQVHNIRKTASLDSAILKQKEESA
jgi:cardiolipin synthase